MNLDALIECDFRGEFPFRPRFATVGGHQMHYVDEGVGDPVILLHGNPTWGFLYRKFIRPLSIDHRVLVPDLIGFGKSDKPFKERFRLADRIAHLEQLLVETLDVKNASLVLHDWGGPIGLGVAVRHPERFRTVVVLNSWCHRLPLGTPLLPVLEQFRAPGVGEALVQGLNVFVEGLLPAGIYRKENITEELLDAYRAPFPDFNSRCHVLEFPRDIPIGEHHPSYRTIGEIEAKLPELDVGVLIVWGRKDPVFSDGSLARWRESFPHAEVVLLEKAGHFLQEDAPAEIVEHISRFLSG
jgi:haloalkane dehalogenase